MPIHVNNQELNTPDEIAVFVHFTLERIPHLRSSATHLHLSVYNLDDAITLSRHFHEMDAGSHLSEIECAKNYIKLYRRHPYSIPKNMITIYVY